MAENGLSERLERIEQKLDQQFSETQEHFVEQRKYIEFVYERLAKRMDGQDKRFEGVDKRFEGLDKRFESLDKRFEGLDERLTGLDNRMIDGFSRLERKFDQVIDARSRPTGATTRRARPSKRRR